MAYIFQTMRIELERAVKKHAHFLSGRLLDVGAGTHDRYSSFFTAKEYVRLNVSPGENTDIVGTAEAIPGEDGSYDGIVCTQVLGDVLDVRKAIGEFARVLKPEGSILLTEGFLDPLHDEPRDFWRFTPHSLSLLFKEAGFSVMVLERIGGYHSVRVQLHARYLIERWDLYVRWYAPLASLCFKLWGNIAFSRDARDTSEANRRFAHGFLIVAKKTS